MTEILRKLEEHNITMHVEACAKFFKYEENVEEKTGTVFLFSRGDKVRLSILEGDKDLSQHVVDRVIVWLEDELDEFIKYLTEDNGETMEG